MVKESEINIKILKQASKIIVAFMLSFAFFIQLQGTETSGGGFQAGAIGATCLILYSVSNKKFKKQIPKLERIFEIIGSFGILIYLFMSIAPIFFDYKSLDLGFLSIFTSYKPYKIGIEIIEIGILANVFSAICTIFLKLKSD